MKKSKKHVFGLLGLCAVGAMTIAAINLPTPGANATANNIDINVNVVETSLSVSFLTPRDGEVFVDSEIEVKSSYSFANNLTYKLFYTTPDGQEMQTPVEQFTPTNDSGTHSFTLDLNRFQGFSNYRLQVVASGQNGTNRDDTVSFEYHALDAAYKGSIENGDPKFAGQASSKVAKIQIQAFHNGIDSVMVDKDGTELPVIIERDAFVDNKFEAVLPFEKYHAKNGSYQAVFTALDDAGNIISIIRVPFEYNKEGGSTDVPSEDDKPSQPGQPGGSDSSDSSESPEVPDTGSLANLLNISRLDYILSGILVFSLVAGFAIYLILRKNHR